MRGKNLWFQYHLNRKTYWRNARTTIIKEAKKQRDTTLAELEQGKIPAATGSNLRFEDLVTLLTDSYKALGNRSLSRLKFSINHLSKFFGGWKAINIESGISRYIAERRNEGAQISTINRELAALKRMFSLARESKKIGEVPRIKLFSEKGRERKGFLEPEEYKRLKDELPFYLKPIFTLGYLTGMRKGEILNLMWDRIDLMEGEITLTSQDTKTKEGRVIPLTPELLMVLKMQRSLHPLSQLVFPNKDGGQITNFYKAWRSACKRAGIKGKIFHDCRRSMIRNAVRSGVPESVAMQISGHKSRWIFDRYNITSKEDTKRAMALSAGYVNERINQIPENSENIVKKDTFSGVTN